MRLVGGRGSLRDSSRRPRRTALTRGDGWAIATLVAIPLLIFGIPAIAGHPAIAQDNLIQNFPLRVLVGRDLRSGWLPLLNPLANSGTPLLGGMNAGAFFPLTLLFVFPGPIVWWVVNLVATYAGAGLGLYALARWHRLGVGASLAGALTYALLGAMNGQMVHLGVIEGYAMLPWYVLALEVLARHAGSRPGPARRTGWRELLGPTAAIALLWGLADLSGEPRAIAEMELLGLVVMIIVILRRGAGELVDAGSRVRFLGAHAIGIGWGALIGLAQLLTGWSFISISQRTGLGYSWFGAGSLPVRWSVLWFIPDVFGGNGILGQPSYFVNYNLPEVTGYAGVVALVALVAFLVARRRGGWSERERPFRGYVAIAVVGAFATWGTYTPLGHLFYLLPLYKSTRLPSRNSILVDLALAVLLAWWLDALARGDESTVRGWRRVATASPALVTAGLAGALMIDGTPIMRFLGAGGSSSMVTGERATLAAHLVVAVAVAVVVIAVRRRTGGRLASLRVLIAVDGLLFFAFSTTGLVGGRAPVTPSRSTAVAYLGTQGRFALVDQSGAHADVFETLGWPNMNVFTRVPSIQGYGSLINALYGDVTGTHPLFSLNACELANGTFHQLRLATVAVSADKLATPLTLASPAPLSCLPVRTTRRTTRYFGRRLPVRDVVIASVDARTVSNGPVSAQLLDATGRAIGPVITKTGRPVVRFDFGRYQLLAAAVRFTSPRGVSIGTALVTDRGANGATYRLVTPFQQALAEPAWHLVNTLGSVTFYRASSVRPAAWVASGGAAHAGSIRQTLNGDTWVTVTSSRGTLLKRSMEWIPGWRANATNERTGRTITLHVVRSGLIQQVEVPPGRWVVHFHYHAPHIELGLAGSAVGGVALLGTAGYLAARRRRRDRVLP